MDACLRPLIVPLSMPSVATLQEGETSNVEEELRNLLDLGFAAAQPLSLVSWGATNSLLGDPESSYSVMSQGAVVGCEDGTLYIFHNTSPNTSEIDRPQSARCAKGTSWLGGNRLEIVKHPSSCAASSTFPFHVASRSRVVSGVTIEDAKALKSHIDPEGDPDKLKNMLKEEFSKEKIVSKLASATKLTPETVSASTNSSMDASTNNARSTDNPTSLLSATNTPAVTPLLHSRPIFPSVMPSASVESTRDTHTFTIRCHVVPAHSGSNQSVTALHLVRGNTMVISLQEAGNLFVHKIVDGMCIAVSKVAEPSFLPPSGIKDYESAHESWMWTNLHAIELEESVIVITCASCDSAALVSMFDASDTSAMEKTRMVIFVFARRQPNEWLLEKVGEWYLDGRSGNVQLYRNTNSTFSILYINNQGQLIEQQLSLLPRLPPPHDGQSMDTDPHNLQHNFTNLAKSFNVLKKPESAVAQTHHRHGRIAMKRELELASLLDRPQSGGLRVCSVSFGLRGAAWSEQEIVVFEKCQESFRKLSVSRTSGIHRVSWVDDQTYAIAFADLVEIYQLQLVNADMQMVAESSSTFRSSETQSLLLHTFRCGTYETLHVAPSSQIVLTQLDELGWRRLMTNSADGNGNIKGSTLWKTSRASTTNPAVRLTAMLPLELDCIVCAYSDGLLRGSSFDRFVCHAPATPVMNRVSDVPLGGDILLLHLVEQEGAKAKYIVGGDSDGTIAFWELESLKLSARWTAFTTPLTDVVQFEELGAFQGCLLCCSRDGTIAIIAVDDLQFLHLIPGSHAALDKICLEADNLMLLYADGRARLWNIKTREFRRSSGSDKADELLQRGGLVHTFSAIPSCSEALLAPLAHTRTLNTASTLLVNISKLALIATSVKLGNLREMARATVPMLGHLRAILSVMLTPGLDEEIDRICQDKLGITFTKGSMGFMSCQSTSLYCGEKPTDLWCISEEVSAAHALGIVILLRMYGFLANMAEDCHSVIAFYAASLAHCAGPSYQPPSPAFLARYWLGSSSEMRQISRLLIDARLSQLSDEDASVLANFWLHYLPCLQPDAEKESMHAALALLLCGYLASEKFNLFSTNTLTDISKSIASYLQCEQSSHQVLAIELCSRGFHIWQQYVDSTELLRALFALGTNSRRDSISWQNTGPQARLAILQIASSNTLLFMTALGLDILDPRDVEHRKSVMQVFAFLIRKRPLVLFPSLPQLLENVVKSLDPNSNSNREAVLDIVTEILGQVVKTFPNVDIHTPTQRLAVGTTEGAIVMYDLKTATRLYVLEGHKTRSTACSFSPDGRRLVTVCLEEGIVLIWKVGSSFTSLFNPGAPPRQGHAGSEPFRTLSFHIDDQASTSLPAVRDHIRFDWTADRSLKLKIFDCTLTFST